MLRNNQLFKIEMHVYSISHVFMWNYYVVHSLGPNVSQGTCRSEHKTQSNLSRVAHPQNTACKMMTMKLSKRPQSNTMFFWILFTKTYKSIAQWQLSPDRILYHFENVYYEIMSLLRQQNTFFATQPKYCDSKKRTRELFPDIGHNV